MSFMIRWDGSGGWVKGNVNRESMNVNRFVFNELTI